tara:strand:- start:188 stop:709 length:522 start_codon:yes stop_codon:yes gene_type:complete
MKLKIFQFNRVRSTNNTAIRLIKNGNDYGVVISEIQTNGKGQRGNKWISKKGNLFISIFLKINSRITLKNITSINLSIIKNIIIKYVKKNIKVKLPNDILIDKKKVCGILQEIIYQNNYKYLIIGIGINVINSPNILKYPTTYLNNYSKKKINKIEIINKIKLNFEKKYKFKK